MFYHLDSADDDAGIAAKRIDPADDFSCIVFIHFTDRINVFFGIKEPNTVILFDLTDKHVTANSFFQQNVDINVLLLAQQSGQIDKPDTGTVNYIQIDIPVNQYPSHSVTSICS